MWFRGSRLTNLNKPLLLKPMIGIGGLFLILQNYTNKPSALVASDLKVNDFFFPCSVGINTTRSFCGPFYNLEKNMGKHLGPARGTSTSGTHLGQV